MVVTAVPALLLSYQRGQTRLYGERKAGDEKAQRDEDEGRLVLGEHATHRRRRAPEQRGEKNLEVQGHPGGV